MLKLSETPPGTQLVCWNKELPAASAQDPLGLTLRVSARLAAELLHCITSITPRARYYSFFPWAFQDYRDNEAGPKSDRGRLKGVLARERAMVLGAVLYHDGSPCEGGALGGSERAQAIAANTGLKTINLDDWQHLQAREGQFGAAYKASLINLGLFQTDRSEVEEDGADGGALAQEVQDIEVVELSERGQRLAEAFHASVQDTRYVREHLTGRSELGFDVLKDFGAAAGLCELSSGTAKDRVVLRDILFSCDRASRETSHYRRRMSLLFLLESARTLGEHDIAFDESNFSHLVYFGRVLKSGDVESSLPVELRKPLRDIAQRWRLFYIHSYLTLALQSLLVCVARVLRQHPGGIDRTRLLDEFDGSAISERFHLTFGLALPASFFELTPRELLTLNGSELGLPDITARFGEASLRRLLLDDKMVSDVLGICLASILLFTVLLRHETIQESNYGAWYQNHVQDPFSDISASGVLAYLREISDSSWLDTKIHRILNRVIWRFVLLQHQTMSYERGFGGSAPLFHIDGTVVIGTQTDYVDPAPLNARFPSAIRILRDLLLLTEGEDGNLIITSEGQAWLNQQLARETSGP